MKKILVLSLLAVSAASQAVIVYGGGGQIPDNQPNNPFTSSITIADGGTLKGIVIEGLTHTWVGDLIATVSGGVGTLFHRIGSTTTTGVGDSSNFNGDYRFQNGGSDIWAEAALGLSSYNLRSGSYSASGALSSAALTLPANIGPGVYTLTISDNAGADIGGLTRWGIDYNPVPEPATMAVLGLGALAAIRRRRAR